MSDIQVGDEVSWNWGNGHPTGMAKEVRTTGKLEIESNGKLVRKNADVDNPAVHVEREGNDVVKRASELERLRGRGEQDNAQVGGEAVVQENEEPKEPKKTTRGGRRGGRKATAETWKKQSEAVKKGAAATAVKKASGRKRGKAAPEDAAVGEKREREGVVEEEGEKEGDGVNMEKSGKKVTSANAEQEEAKRAAGKKAKKAKSSPERRDEYVPGEEPEEVEEAVLAKLVSPTGLDVGAAGAEPHHAAETASEGVAVTASIAAGSTKRMEVAVASEEAPSPTSEKKQGSRKGATRGKAVA